MLNDFLKQGTPIEWKKGKNVTVKTIKKKQKHKSKGSVRTVSKTVQNDSFFNFFSPPTGMLLSIRAHFSRIKLFFCSF
jgi:hypothetical protein